MVERGGGTGAGRLTGSAMLRAMARRLALVAALALAAIPMAAGSADASTKARFMTRNLYLGADLTPGIQSKNLDELYVAAGKIYNQVKANKFGVRAKGLAAEIVKKDPHLVGLQESALWRTAPCTSPSTQTNAFNYTKGLLGQLNKDKPRYHLAVSKQEFDFAYYADTDENKETTGTGCPAASGGDIIVRLTMRDVILAKNGVTTSHPKSGTFDTLLQVNVGGVKVNVIRGWTAVDAKIGTSKGFRFVNTHLEAFDNTAKNHTNKDTDVGNGRIRLAQAKELFAPGGPAGPALPRVILVGDLNSDKNTPQKPGDGLAHSALLNNGFFERSTSNPFGCCLNSALLTVNGGGAVSDFDHKVDHIMSRPGDTITLNSSAVTGRQPVNGFWDSDHAGLFSTLQIP